jgi:hypothetical protein
MQVPVAFMIFNRPDVTEQVFREIAKARPPKLFVIADGPRPEQPGEAQKCAATRAVVERVDWDCEVVKNYSDVNLGCGLRVATGVSWVFQQVDRAIFLEDDCLPHPTFFRFCEELLERYYDDERVMHVSGTNLQMGHKRGPSSYYFSRLTNVWGWASWRRAWQSFDLEVKQWPQFRDTSWLLEILGDPRAAQYWREQFERAYQSKERWWTWDYQWNFAALVHNGLSIVPNVNLISNIGFGEDATNTKWAESRWANLPQAEMPFPLQHPPKIVRHKEADDFIVQEIVRTHLPQPETVLNRALKEVRKVYTTAVPKSARMFLRNLRKLP